MGGYLLGMLGLFYLLAFVRGYQSYYGSLTDGRVGCRNIISRCITDIGEGDKYCSNLWLKYSSTCTDPKVGEVLQCTDSCRAAFSLLLEHRLYASFLTCDCEGSNICVKQKCTLLEDCLEIPCEDKFTPTEPPPTLNDDSIFFSADTSSTPSDRSITMSTTTESLGDEDCENIIVNCNDSLECSDLLDKRDTACAEEKETSGPDQCSKSCVDANTALLESPIGIYMRDCVFRSVDLEATRLANLIRRCSKTQLPTSQTPMPSITDRFPTRPEGDCKRHYEECRKRRHCRLGFKSMSKECNSYERNPYNSCTSACLTAISEFRANSPGGKLFNCRCGGVQPSRNCQSIKEVLSTPCDNYSTAPPLSTEIHSVSTTESGDTGLSKEYFTVNHTCTDKIIVLIMYSSKLNKPPVITAADRHCFAKQSTANVMKLELEYESGTCGTEKTNISDNKVNFRNTIYVRSATEHSHFNAIHVIDCAIARYSSQATENSHYAADSKEGQINMTFYRDEEFRTHFNSYPEVLGDNKRVYVEVQKSNISAEKSVFIESCFATPTGREDHPTPHYFLHNGCIKDASFKIHSVMSETDHTRFSFYKMRFAEHNKGKVYIHCSVTICNTSDEDCRLYCRSEPSRYEKVIVSQGPYIYTAGSTSLRISLLTLILTIFCLIS